MVDSSDQEVLELFRLQESADLVTLKELHEELRERSVPVGARRLAYYVSEGLVPKSLRIGARAGAYPRKVIDLITFVSWAREAGFPIEAIKKLRPLWLYMEQVRVSKRLDLRRLQEFASIVTNDQEGFLFTTIVDVALRNCPNCHDRVLVIDELIRKNGKVQRINHEEGLELPVGQLSKDGNVDPFRMLQLRHPVIEEDKLIVLGGEPDPDYEVRNARFVPSKKSRARKPDVTELSKEGGADQEIASA